MIEKRYARKTAAEVMADFPIGTEINRGSVRHLEYGYLDKVEGYVFDGEYWYPAQDSWDGWYPFFGDDEDDELYEPPINQELEWLKGV